MKYFLTILTLLYVSIICGQTFTDTTGPHYIGLSDGTSSPTCGTSEALELPLNVTGIGTLGVTNSIKSITINATHVSVSQLRIALVSPDNTYRIISNNRGNGANLTNTVFSDIGPSLNTGVSPHTGTFAPQQQLSYLNNNAENGDGIWKLLICDSVQYNTGSLLDWSITFEPTPSCSIPGNPSVSLIRIDSARLWWSDTSYGSTYDIELVDITAGESFTGIPDIVDIASTPFYDVSGLNPLHTYQPYVRAKCDNGNYSDWLVHVPFTTTLTNDDISGANTMDFAPSPAGIGCASSTFTIDFPAQGTTDSGDDTNCSNNGTGLDQFFNWTATTDALLFTSGNGDPGIAIKYASGTELDCASPGSYQNILSGWSVGQNITIQIYDSAGESSPLSFCLEEYSIPDCLPPASFSATNETDTTIDLTWTESTDETTTPWDASTIFSIEYGPTGFIQGNGTTVNNITNQFYTISGLIEFTEYDIYIIASCDTNGLSTWVGPITQRTLYTPPVNDNICDATALAMNSSSLYENYGATLEVGENGPVCFELYTSGLTSVWFSFEAPTSGEVRLRTDKIIDGITNVFDLDVAIYELNTGCSSAFNSGGLTELSCDEYSGSKDSGYYSSNSNFVTSGLTPGLTYYIQIGNGNVGAIGDFYLQLFDNNPPSPTCLPPVATLSDIVYDYGWETSLSWIEGSGQESWDIEFINITDGEVFTGTQTTYSPINNSPYTLDDLELGNQYAISIRTNCSDGQVSAWSTPIYFEPLYNDTFAEALPIEIYESSGCNTPFVMLDNLATDSGMDGSCDGIYTGKDEFYSWTATSETLIWNTLADGYPGIVVRDNLGNEIDCASTSALPNHILSGWSIGDDLILQVYDYAGGYQDVSFCLEIPNCLDPSDITASNIKYNEADISWTENGIIANWSIEYGPTGFTQGTGTVINDITETTQKLSSLTQLTTYDVYVQGDCTNENTTNWVGPYSFTTPISPPSYDRICFARSLPLDTSFLASNIGATQQTGEANINYPNCFEDPTTLKSVWFKFVAPASGQVRIRTDLVTPETTLTDTELAIYELDTDCNNYFGSSSYPIRCDQDSGDGGLYPNNSNYTVSFLTPGETYHIQVSGRNPDDEGKFIIRVGNIPDPDTITMVGDAVNGWPDATNLYPDAIMINTQPGIYKYYGFPFSAGKMKFRTNFDWGQPSYGGDSFPFESTFTNDDITVPEGVYDVIINFNTNVYSFTPSTIFSNIGIVGDAANGWPSTSNPATDILMTTTDGVNYELLNQNLTSGLLKFRENYAWQNSWANSDFPFGIGETLGSDIQIPENGNYNIYFNRRTKSYSFVLNNPPTIGIVGDAANGWPDSENPTTDIIMSSYNGYNYTLENQQLTNGTAKFRQNLDWAQNWGNTNFPSGTSIPISGPAIPITEGLYNINFNRLTGDYNFELVKIIIAPKVFLQGATLSPNAGEENLMRDDLRVLNIIPTTSPYDTATCDPYVFNTTGANAIVDWVLVELRDEMNNTQVIDSQSALIQRDGDIVAIDGLSPIIFNQLAGNYFISIKHRNHLGIMTSNSLNLSSVSKSINFTDASNQITYGSNAQSAYGVPSGIVAMWTGNANGDIKVRYQGSGNDTNSIKDDILGQVGNTSNLFAYIAYNNADINMDGTIRYQGSGNDSITIKDVVLGHPNNNIDSNLFSFTEQLPEN